jgi:signal transduction histidine kinase
MTLLAMLFRRQEQDTAEALRRSESELRLLTAQLLAAQDLERQRIARELHDGIGQALGGIKFCLENCAGLLSSGGVDAAAARIGELTGKIQLVVDEVRRIAVNLRPASLDDLGLLATLSWFFREFRAVHTSLHLESNVEVSEDEIPQAAKTTIYRIVQEAFNNAVSHAEARNLWLTMHREDNYLELRVRDDGVGFDARRFAAVQPDGRGLGLASMRERAEACGGRLIVKSQPGAGTTVLVRWPLAEAERRACRRRAAPSAIAAMAQPEFDIAGKA